MSSPHMPMAEPQPSGTAQVQLQIDHPDPVTLSSRIYAACRAIRALLPTRARRIQLAPDEETSEDGPLSKTERTSKAKICSIVTTVLVASAVAAIVILSKKYNRFENHPLYYSTHPRQEDGKASRCYERQGDYSDGWRNSIDADRNGIKRVASISTDLDTTGGLFFVTRGSFASGVVSYVSARSARVDVEVRYRDFSYRHPRDWEHKAAFYLCHMTREDNHHGVGLYLPDKWDSPAIAAYDVRIIVSLPEGRYKALESQMADMYGQNLSFSSGTRFGNVTLGGSAAKIHAESLETDYLSVRTEGWGGGISGNFAARNAAELVTSWGDIDADITLGGHGVHEPQLRLQQPQYGSLRSTVRMIESPRFLASVFGGGGPINLRVASLPVNATLNLDMRNIGECPHLTLPATFEGTIFQRSSRDYRYLHYSSCAEPGSDLMPTLEVRVGDDPAALGRKHEVTTEFQMGAMRRDTVSWGGPTQGFVAVETGNGRAGVDIVKDWRH